MEPALIRQARQARGQIVSGALRGARLLDLLLSVPALERDCWVDELLGLEDPGPDMAGLPRGSVPYLPCGVAEILAAVQEVPVTPGDVFVDLGSGLGRVVMLVHLLCGAQTVGLELQPQLVRAARARALALRLDAVEFVHANSTETAQPGSIYFMYAPFNGDTLTRALERMRETGPSDGFVVCGVGVELAHVPWLRARPRQSPALTLYDAR